MKLQIKDWEKHFENDRSRSRAKCSFVCVPNKQHGMGFCRIMAEPDGAAIYGIWHCLVGACSQQPSRHGLLTADGEQTGSAWGVEDLALKFRRPENEIARAIQVLCSEKVGWLIDLDSPPTHRAVTADSPLGTLKEEKEGKGIEGIEGKGNVASLQRTILKKPSIDEIKLQAAKIGLPEAEAEKFFNYYESNGWMVGRNKMKSWSHALTNWKNNAQNYGNSTKPNYQNNNGKPIQPVRGSTAVGGF